jgi:hypothetical protein
MGKRGKTNTPDYETPEQMQWESMPEHTHLMEKHRRQILVQPSPQAQSQTLIAIRGRKFITEKKLVGRPCI